MYSGYDMLIYLFFHFAGICTLLKKIHYEQLVIQYLKKQSLLQNLYSKILAMYKGLTKKIVQKKYRTIVNDTNDWAMETMYNSRYKLNLVKSIILANQETKIIVLSLFMLAN